MRGGVTVRERLRRLDAKALAVPLHRAVLHPLRRSSARSRSGTRRGSRSRTATCSRRSTQFVGLAQLRRRCSTTRTSGTRSRTRSGSGCSRPSRSSCSRSVIAHVLNTSCAARTFFRMSHPAAAGDLARRGRADLHAALRLPLRPRQLRPRPGRHRQHRLGGGAVLVLVRAVGDGDVALDRLQRAHLPRGDAGDPEELYEAAAIDGARRWRQFIHVTIPMLRPTIIFTVIISTIGGLQLFTEPYLFQPIKRRAPAAPTGSTRRSRCTCTRSFGGSAVQVRLRGGDRVDACSC